MRLLPRLLTLAAAPLLALCGTPQEVDFSEITFASGLSQPTCMAWAPDGSNRLFVCLKAEGVRIVQNGQVLPAPFATFPQLYTASECGVLGLAFDPNYAANKYVYVFVTVSASEQRIVRFTDSDNIGTSRTTILGNLPTRGANHDGGALGFGPDGKLYFAIGDLGNKTGVDNDLSTLAAKVGRCNPDGSVPTDNPFADGPGPRNDYIWATGFRNPFTLTFQPGTGKLWLNVVGSDPGGQTNPNSGPGYEQVFIVNAGSDGGYDDWEGNQPLGVRYTEPFPRPLIRPRIQYKTGYNGASSLRRLIRSIGPVDGHLVARFTAPHPFRVGEAIDINGTGVYDGTHVVQAGSGGDSVALPLPAGATARVTFGNAQPAIQGGSIGGGCFYASSGFPATFAGNFFYCDFVGGLIMRAQLDADNKPRKISRFVIDANSPVDTAIGPDGALYYAEYGTGKIQRVSFQDTPRLLVSPTDFYIQEGYSSAFQVRLSSPPAAEISVLVHKVDDDGDGTHDIEITEGAALTFNAENYDQPQSVIIAALLDDDTLDDSTVFSVTAPGYEPVDVAVGTIDRNLPGFLVSETSFTLLEGAKHVISVKLAARPVEPVQVSIRGITGAFHKVVVKRGALLLFTPENFDVPQTVEFKAVDDRSPKDRSVTLNVTARFYRKQPIHITVLNNDPFPPNFTSVPRSHAVLGSLWRYDADAVGLPAPTFELLEAPTGMILDGQTGELTWAPEAPGIFAVKLRALNSEGDAIQSFTLTVAPDQPPTAFITKPHDGDIVSGANAEFFGGSIDDLGTYKAEFSIDGVLVYTDENREAHYHLGGAHSLFDTTALSNGPHTLKLKVYDDKQQSGEREITVTVAN